MPAVLLAQTVTTSYYLDAKMAPREKYVDFIHLDLHVSFEPAKGKVIGKVIHSFKPLRKNLDTLYLDALRINVTSVKLNGKRIAYDSNEKGVGIKFLSALDWNKQYKLEVEYTSTPEKGLYFVGWNDPKNMSRKQVWTQGQGIDNRQWIPMYDEMNDKVKTDLHITFENGYEVLSNGDLIKKKAGKETTVWHYRMTKQHAPYLIMLGIGKYKINKTKSKSGVPLNLYYYPEWEDRVAATYRYSARIMDFLEREIGVPYPWNSYSQIPVQDFMFGAMENTTATLFGDFYHVDERAYIDKNYVSVNAHELAHQWFGDLVTARSSRHHWLQESFATYYNNLAERDIFGKDHYAWKIRGAAKSALKASKKDYKPIAHSKAGGTRHYPKGSHVLHMLKYVVGEEEYRKSVKYYLEKHQYDNVDSEDLLIAFHETLGLSLDWFWNQWVYGGGEPHYFVKYQTIKKEGKFYAQFIVDQQHDQDLLVGSFKMPIVFRVVMTDGKKITERTWIEKQQEVVEFPLNGDNVLFALFDVGSNVLKKLDFKKDLDMLRSQSIKAEHMIDRYDAYRGLKEFELDKKKDLLLANLERETFHVIRNEIINQLCEDDDLAKVILPKALKDKNSRVRINAIKHFKVMNTTTKNLLRPLLKDSSYNIVEQALKSLCRLDPLNAKEYLDMTKNEVGVGGARVKITWLETSYKLFRSEDHLKQLIEHTSNSYEFRTRVNAANALKRLNRCTAPMMRHLFRASVGNNHRLAGPCRKVILYFYNQSDYADMILDVRNSMKFTDRNALKIKKFLKKS